MPEPQPRQDVTELIEAWQQGDAQALERLLPLVYGELRRVRARLRGERGHTWSRPRSSTRHICGWLAAAPRRGAARISSRWPRD
jgi:hypothetical protein